MTTTTLSRSFVLAGIRPSHGRSAAAPVLAPVTAASWNNNNKFQFQSQVQSQGQPSIRFHSTRPDQQQSSSSKISSSSSSSKNVFMDLIAAMRWKAANALTSSLSEDERSQLIQRLDKHSSKSSNNNITASTGKETNGNQVNITNNTNVDDNVDVLVVPPHTIAEAVAAARAQEAQRSQQKWNTEKETLMREAETAARARVEADWAIQRRRLQFEQWKQQLKHAQETTTSSPSSSSSTTDHETAAATAASQEGQKEQHQEHYDQNTVEAVAVAADNNSPSSSMEEDDTPHPILGPCILNLGYKRIHVVGAEELTAIPVWEKQRIYRNDRAKKMAEDKLKSLDLGLPGVLCIHENKEGKLSILDGQHRIGMLDALSKSNKATELLDKKVLVEVYPQLDHHGDNHAQDIFLEINKAEPIKLVDLIAKKGDRNMLTAAAEALAGQYEKMFSPSQRCRPPHLNVDNLRDALFAANVIVRHNIKTAPQLQDWMLQQNQVLKIKYTNPEDPARGLVTPAALKKALEQDFYLGLESSWYYK